MRVWLELGGEDHELFIHREADKLKITVGGDTFEAKVGESGLVTLGGERYQVEVRDREVVVDGQVIPFRISALRTGAAAGDAAGGPRGARIKPPMPGKIVSLAVNEGDEVKPGQVLLILEAMKMQNEITSPAGGVVKKVHVQPGQNVEGKDVLVEIE